MKSTSISIPSKEKNLSYVTIKRCILHTKIHYYMLSVKKEKKMFDLFQLCHQFHLFRGYYSNKIVTNKEKSLTGRVKLTKRLALFKWLIENIQDKNRESAMESLPGWLNQQRRMVIETSQRSFSIINTYILVMWQVLKTVYFKVWCHFSPKGYNKDQILKNRPIKILDRNELCLVMLKTCLISKQWK